MYASGAHALVTEITVFTKECGEHKSCTILPISQRSPSKPVPVQSQDPPGMHAPLLQGFGIQGSGVVAVGNGTKTRELITIICI